MKNKRKIYIAIIIGAFIISVGTIIKTSYSYALGDSLIDRCKYIEKDGGSYRVTFNTNGGNTLSDATVCVGCNPAIYDSSFLPIPEKKGYKFDGWYYDSKLTKKVESKTINVGAVSKYDSNGCMVGYEVVTLYANWKKSDVDCPIVKSGGGYIVYFNTNGGSEIVKESVCIACGKEMPKLPVPEKKGYTFVGWYYDSKLTKKVESTTIDVGAIHKYDSNGCESGYEDVTLYARWAKPENKAIIKGVLLDANGKPLANYIVELHSDVITSITNDKGEYIFEHVEEGSHTLYVKTSDQKDVTSSSINVVYDGNTDEFTNTYSYEDKPIVLDLKISKDNVLVAEIQKNNTSLIVIIGAAVVLIMCLLVLGEKSDRKV